MNIQDKVILYEPIDCEGLATTLATDAWEEEVKARGLTREDLYQAIIVYGNDKEPLQEQVRPEWAYNFFALREKYLSLINEHKIPKHETGNT